MLYLDEAAYIGKGSERYCYRHPDCRELCIKISYREDRGNKQNRKEYHYYKKLEKRVAQWSHIPKCHGWVETNLGDGLVFDLVQSESGAPCESIKELLEKKRLTHSDLSAPLEELHRYLLKYRILISDLNPKNVLCGFPDRENPRLYLIDGIGNSDFIKAADKVPFLARAKINRHWTRFIAKL